jgi:hypothetical protein
MILFASFALRRAPIVNGPAKYSPFWNPLQFGRWPSASHHRFP